MKDTHYSRPALLLVFILTLILSGVAILGSLDFLLRDWLMEDWRVRLENRANQFARQMEEHMLLARDKLAVLADNPLVTSLERIAAIDRRVNGLPEHEIPATRRVLDRFLERSPDFSVIFLLLPNGDHYYAHPFAVQKGLKKYNLADRPYVQLARRQPVISDGFLGADGVLATAIAIPVLDAQDEVMAHMGGVMRLAQLSQLVEKGRIGVYSSAFVVDRQGHLLAHTDLSRLIPGQREGFARHPMVAPMLDGRVRVGEVREVRDPEDGRDYLAAYIPLSFGWGLVLTKDLATIHGQVHRMVGITAGVVFLCLLVVGSLGSFQLQRLGRRWEEARAAVVAGENRLRLLTDAVPGAVFQYRLDAAGAQSFTFLSKGGEALLGLNGEEVLREFNLAWRLVHPDDVAALTRSIRHSADTLTPWSHEFRLRKSAGVIQWVRGNAIPHPPLADGSIIWDGLLVDANAQKDLEEALRLERDKFFQILSAMRDGVYIVDQKFNVLFVNATVEEDFGPYDGSKCYTYFHDRGEPCPWCKNPLVFEGHSVRSEWRSDKTGKIYDQYDSPLHQSDGAIVKLKIIHDITQRKRMEDALRTSEALLRATLESSREGVLVVDGQGRVIVANAKFAQMWRIDPNLVKGGEDERLLASVLDQLQEPERFLDKVRRLYGTLEAGADTLLFRDGRVFERFSAPLVQNDTLKGRLWSFSDVTDRVRAERALEHHRLQLQRMFDNASDAIFVHDDHGRFVEVNRQACESLGYAREELIALDVAAIDITVAWPEIALLWREMVPGVSHHLESLHRRKDGVTFPVEVRVSAYEAGGEKLFVAMVRDIAERKAALEQLHRAKQAADAASQAKSEFLATMSHEIRTPITAILGMAELLRETILSGEQLQFLKVLRHAGDSLLDLINDILDFSRIEAGELQLVAEPFELGELVAGTVAVMALRAQDKGMRVGQVLPEGLALCRVGDYRRLRQVLFNLMSNAVKFTNRGEVVLVVAPLADDADVLHFQVRDTGIGIPADKLEYVFQAFAQVDSGVARKYHGSGLGLAITQRLVGMMGGSIRVESVEGHGSIFHVTLPLPVAGGEGDACCVTLAEPLPAAVWDLSGLRILLAEDSEDNILLFRGFLKGSGVLLFVVNQGDEAVAAVQREPFDLVLMDVQMPVMDGLSATRAIRAWEQGRGGMPLPIIALTAHAFAEDVQRTLQAGCDRHLTKPLRKAQFLATIAQCAGRDGRDLREASAADSGT